MSEMTKFIRYLIDNPSYDQTISNYTINLHKVGKEGNLFANMYNTRIFPMLVDYLHNKTRFNDITKLIGSNNRIRYIMYNGLKKTNMIMNPLYSVKGTKNNTMFNFENTTPDNPNSKCHITYLATQKSNLLSYYHTIQGKEFFAYIALESQLNLPKHKSIVNSSCKEYIDIVKEISDPKKPWSITNVIKNYKILIRDDLAICGGRPGVPNSIYISMVDNSWIFMFSKGTCLIITGKQNIDAGLIDGLDTVSISRKSFLITFINNILSVLNIVFNVVSSDDYIRTTYEFFDVKCNHTSNKMFCQVCSPKALLDVNEFTRITRSDIDRLTQTKLDLYANYISNSDVLLIIEEMCNGNNSLLNLVNFGVAGMRYKDTLDSIVSNDFTDEERRHINIFSGKKVIFKSIKSVDMLVHYQDIFFDKKNKLDTVVSDLKVCNIFSLNMSEKESILKSVGF
jgi:hypothetical protein